MTAKTPEGFRFAVRLFAMYRAAAWLYYHGPADVESPLSDTNYDELEQALNMPKTLAHTIQLTEEEQARAIAWGKDPLSQQSSNASSLPGTV